MSEIIERMARAMEDDSKFCLDAVGSANLRMLARVALAAIREPTWNMLMAASIDMRLLCEAGGDQKAGAAIWRSMVDEALR